MTRLTKTIIDGATNTAIEVELTADEIEQLQIRETQELAATAAREAAEQAKADAKASGIAKLLALGLTEEEARALVN